MPCSWWLNQPSEKNMLVTLDHLHICPAVKFQKIFETSPTRCKWCDQKPYKWPKIYGFHWGYFTLLIGLTWTQFELSVPGFDRRARLGLRCLDRCWKLIFLLKHWRVILQFNIYTQSLFNLIPALNKPVIQYHVILYDMVWYDMIRYVMILYSDI